jgi:type I restriction enzyme, S subunit
MDAEQLLEHFDRVAEAPGSIAALRRFILDLAVRGKLVDQDPNDEPASKKFEHLAELTNFDLATGWLSGKFGDLLNMQYGKNLPKESREKKGKVPVFGSNGIVGFTDVALVEQSVIVIGRKGSAGAINLCSEPSWTTDVSYFIIPPNFFDIRFLLFSLESLNLKTLSKGVKPGLSRSEAYQLSISIPSLSEQHRIVAKVDELMDLCDRLEAAQKNRENLRDRLVAASLHQLNQAADSNEEFFDHARFYFDNLAKLSVRSEHIKQLRQTILTLALSGKLIVQNPENKSALILLEQIIAVLARIK